MEDYYINEQGLLVFTAKYHLKRGYCCKNGCKHCPYKNKAKTSKEFCKSLKQSESREDSTKIKRKKNET